MEDTPKQPETGDKPVNMGIDPTVEQLNSDTTTTTEKPKHPGGRPSIYSQELADKICAQLADGYSMRTVSKHEDMPCLETMFRWIREKPEFREQYARATEERTEAQSEILLEIGDEAIDAAQESDPKAANAVVSGYKLKADNLKWSMSKMKPKKYGDKVDVTSGGEKIKGNSIIFSNFKEDEK